jgi:hypothetical protein
LKVWTSERGSSRRLEKLRNFIICNEIGILFEEDEMGGASERMAEIKNAYRVLVEKPEETTWMTSVDGRILLKFILKKQSGSLWIGVIWLRLGTCGGSCKHGNEPWVP